MELLNTEIVVSYSGKISTGKFENSSPFFSIKESWKDIDRGFLENRQKELYNICYERFIECERREIADRIKEQRKDIRFYEHKGEQFPSVTSVINWDKDLFVSMEQLAQYGARGTILHKQAELFLKTGKVIEPKDIPEIYPDFVILKKGSLGLSLDMYNFPAFFEKHKFDVIELEKTVVNEEHKYAGRCDIKGIYNGKVTLFDIKTGTIEKIKAFEQLSAYAKSSGNEDVVQLMIIPLNNTTQQGFSKPEICDDFEKYWSLFLQDRKHFYERFGI